MMFLDNKYSHLLEYIYSYNLEILNYLKDNSDWGYVATSIAVATGMRRGEIIGLKWQDIDFKRGLWTIPADKMKAGRLHIVPLAPQAIAILEQIKALGYSDQYVFFNTSYKSITSYYIISALYRKNSC